MEFIDESQKVIGRINILVHYDPNVKILLNRRLCEVVVWLCNKASRFCLPFWKRCETALPSCELSLKELYRQLVLGETLIQSSSSQHFWKLREQETTERNEVKTVEYLHSCDRALKDWESLVITGTKSVPLKCERMNHTLTLSLNNEKQLCVEHSCGSADQEMKPIKFRKGKVIHLPCTSEHWLKLSIIEAPHGALMVQFILDLYWHIMQVNRSLLKSQEPDEQKRRVSGSLRWIILGSNVLLNQVYKELSGERERGLGSFSQCQEDCKLLLTKLRYVIDQGRGVEDTQKPGHGRHHVAEFVLHKLEDRFSLVNTEKIVPQVINSKAEFGFLPEYLNVDEKRVHFVSYISSGAFGAVYSGTCLGESLAFKLFESVPDAHLKDTFRNELIILYKLRHFHIVQLVGYYVPEKGGHAIVLELMESENLWQKIEKRSATIKSGQQGLNSSFSLEAGTRVEATLSPYPLHVAVDILLQIARAMKYSHDSGVMHRDIKARNILVKRITTNCNSERIDLSKEGYAYVKLTDYGLSTQRMYPVSNVGTSFWKAPEVIGRGQQEYSKSADVYSFAITCSEVFQGQVPFMTKERLSDDQHSEVLRRGERPSLTNCPPYLADYIQRCWDSIPENRPSFADICIVLQHYKGVLMRPKSVGEVTVTAHPYRISTEEDIVELACYGGLTWVTREAVKNGVDTVSHNSFGCSRIPRDVLYACLERWDYPEKAASSPESGVDESALTELAPGSFLEGFERLCVVQYSWRDVLLGGLREAWQLVGDQYANWLGGSHDFKKALPWFQRAANCNHPDAFFRLGLCYEAGYGVEKDMDKAKELYSKAADKHSSSACVSLGLIYWLDPKAIVYWQRALQYQNSKGSSIWIIKIWINFMRSNQESFVSENAVFKLHKMSWKREDSLGRQLLQLLAGPQYSNVKFFVEALGTTAHKQRATVVMILRNLSKEPQIAQRIHEVGGTQVLFRLVKESFEPDSKLLAQRRRLVETFCNVKPINQDLVLQDFRLDGSDPLSGFKPEELEIIYELAVEFSSPKNNDCMLLSQDPATL